MKEPFTTNSFGNVSRQDNSPNKHMRKKLKVRAKDKAVKTARRRERLVGFALRRNKALRWLETNVKESFAVNWTEAQCPMCRKRVYLCQTPRNAIAWSNTPARPWLAHGCAVDTRSSNAKFAEVEIKHHQVLSANYLTLRTAMTGKAGPI